MICLLRSIDARARRVIEEKGNELMRFRAEAGVTKQYHLNDCYSDVDDGKIMSSA